MRRAPWVLTLDVQDEIAGALAFLEDLGVRDVGVVLRAFPQVLAPAVTSHWSLVTSHWSLVTSQTGDW